MNITDELERLGKLRKDGTLSDEEFAQVKGKLLNQRDNREPVLRDNALLEALNRNSASRKVTGLIMIVIVLIVIWYLHTLYG